MTEESRKLIDELEEGLEYLAQRRIMTRDQLIQDYAKIIDDLREENERLKTIINDTLKEIPVGYIPDHTAEKLPTLVKGWIKDGIESYNELEKLAEKNLNTYTEVKFGYKNKHTQKWLYFYKSDELYHHRNTACAVDFSSDILYSTRNIIEEDFDGAIANFVFNRLNREDWDLVCLEVTYSRKEERVITN